MIVREKKFEEVGIKSIRPGDYVFHEGAVRTVSESDIKRCDFMGVTLFGDCYRLGLKKVVRVIYA